MKKKQLVVCMVVLLLLSGCVQQSVEEETTTDIPQATTEQTSQQTEENVPIQEGGTLYLSMRNTKTLNPLLNQDASVDDILKLLYMPLLRLDETHKPAPSIAESWQFDEGGTVLTMHLRQDLYWQDGSGITADDVIYSFRILEQADDGAVYKDCMGYISGYRKIDAYTIEIQFYQNFSGNLYALQMPIVSNQYYGTGNLEDSSNNMIPMGNGYFQFEKYTPAKEMVLKRCSSSFGADANIEEIIVNISTDEDTDLYSFAQGLTDVLEVNSSEMGKSDNENASRIYDFTTNYYDFIGFNFTKSLFQDINIRKAIAYATPKESMLESVYLGHGILTESYVNPTYWFYEPNVTTYDFSLAEARRALEASNWKDTNDDGILDRTTNELSETLHITILYNTENEIRKQIATRLGDELRGLGIEVSLDGQSYEGYVQKLQAGDFDIFVGGWQFSTVPNYSFILHSAQIGKTNYIGYQNEEVDRLLGVVYNAVQETEIKAAYSNLQKKTAEELPYVSIAFRNSMLLASDRLRGNVVPLENNVYATINEWFLYEKEQ